MVFLIDRNALKVRTFAKLNGACLCTYDGLYVAVTQECFAFTKFKLLT